jgi:putative ABC transport system permease protein
MLNRLKTALSALLRRSQVERELDDELRYHIEQQTEQNIRLGMNPEEARCAAQKAFGGVEQAKERSRDARGVRWIEDTWQDLRYGARMLAKQPGFTLIAVVTLAIGIGANTAIFSIVNGVLINPLPYPDGDRLMTIYASHDLPPGMLRAHSITPADFVAWRAQQKSFSEMFAFTGSYTRLTGVKEPAFIPGFTTTSRFFETLGVKPILGRGFLPEEELPGRQKVVVISHAIWQSYLDADPNAIGKTLRFNDVDYTVIGVLPPDFKFTYQVDALFAYQLNPNERDHWLAVVGRLKDGVKREQAWVETKLIAESLQKADPRPGEGRRLGADLVPLGRLTGEGSRRLLLILFSATSFVLLIACANLANLLSARASGRHREIAIRAALGAGRRRLISQLLTESLLLATLGGMVGVLMAWLSINWLVSLAPAELSRANVIGIDVWVLAFALLMVIGAGVTFGLAPVLKASKPDLTQSLKGGDGLREGRWRRINSRGLLIAGEVGLAMVLLTGAGLLINSLIRLLRVNPGFASENVLAVDVPSSDNYSTRERKIDFYQKAIERFRTIPGVESVGTINLLPFGEMLIRGNFLIEGQPESPERWALKPTVSPNYFEVIRMPILKGRGFNEHDTDKTPGVVVISESCARRYFADGDPIGRQISLNNDPSGDPIWLEIVGMTGDVKQTELRDEAVPTIYTPFSQARTPFMIGGLFVLRSSVEPDSLIASIRGAIRAIDPELPIYKANTMDELIAETTKGQRFSAFLLGILAGLALALSAVGLFGLLSYLVSQRTREIGIRIALGAKYTDMFRWAIRQGMLPVVMGMTVGLGASVALTRLMKSLLFEVSATDPTTFVVSGLLLALVAFLACWLPARRAAKVDPLVALKYE